MLQPGLFAFYTIIVFSIENIQIVLLNFAQTHLLFGTFHELMCFTGHEIFTHLVFMCSNDLLYNYKSLSVTCMWLLPVYCCGFYSESSLVTQTSMNHSTTSKCNKDEMIVYLPFWHCLHIHSLVFVDGNKLHEPPTVFD